MVPIITAVNPRELLVQAFLGSSQLPDMSEQVVLKDGREEESIRTNGANQPEDQPGQPLPLTTTPTISTPQP